MEEVLRAVRLCQPDWEVRRRITFAAVVADAPAWLGWRDNVLPAMLPEIEIARDAASRGALKEVFACDENFEKILPPELTAASRQAGQALLSGNMRLNGDRLWLRYLERLNEGKTPGHFIVVMALRAAGFHIAPGNFLAAYLFLEASGGWKKFEAPRCVEMMEDCLASRRAAPFPILRAA